MADVRKYIERAREFQAAVQILCGEHGRHTLSAIGLLASHAIELALKAYLVKHGKTEKEIKNIGHDLSLAWREAKNLGLRLQWDEEYTMQVLNLSHSVPYLFRYPITGVAEGITAPEVLNRHLETIITEVEINL